MILSHEIILHGFSITIWKTCLSVLMDPNPSRSTLPPRSSQHLTTSSFVIYHLEHILSPSRWILDLMSSFAYPHMHFVTTPSSAFQHASLGLPKLRNHNLGAPHHSTCPCTLSISCARIAHGCSVAKNHHHSGPTYSLLPFIGWPPHHSTRISWP